MEILKRFLRMAGSWIEKAPEPEKNTNLRFAVSWRDFDPLHLWHLQVAQCAWDEQKLDFVLFVPKSASRSEKLTFDPEFRYRMVHAATKKIPQFRASRINIDNPNIGLAEMLKKLKAQYGLNSELSLIVGANDIEKIVAELYGQSLENLKLCRLLIAPRIGEPASAEKIKAKLPEGVQFGIMDVPVSNVTSKMVNCWYKNGRSRSADFLVPNTVRRMITRRRLGLIGMIKHWIVQRTSRKPLRTLALSMGTFNPIHLWHLLAAVCALEQFADRVLFIPNGDPPHKEGVVNKFLRLRMLNAAIKRIPGAASSRIEIDRPGKSYTIDTLKQLKAIYGPDVEFCLIVGMDNLQQLADKKWYQTDEILGLCRLLIAPRATEIADREKIKAILPPLARFEIIDTADSNVSSSLIRDWYSRGRARSADFLVPNRVRCIINHAKPYSQNDKQKTH